MIHKLGESVWVLPVYPVYVYICVRSIWKTHGAEQRWQDVEQEFIDAVKWLEGKGVSGITGISAESFRGSPEMTTGTMWDDEGSDTPENLKDTMNLEAST